MFVKVEVRLIREQINALNLNKPPMRYLLLPTHQTYLKRPSRVTRLKNCQIKRLSESFSFKITVELFKESLVFRLVSPIKMLPLPRQVHLYSIETALLNY